MGWGWWVQPPASSCLTLQLVPAKMYQCWVTMQDVWVTSECRDGLQKRSKNPTEFEARKHVENVYKQGDKELQGYIIVFDRFQPIDCGVVINDI